MPDSPVLLYMNKKQEIVFVPPGGGIGGYHGYFKSKRT